MFTGIVQDQVTIQDVHTTPSGVTLSLSLPRWGTPQVGESILLHGICSTVTAVSKQHFTVDYMPETMRCTTVGTWAVGQRIHAEPAATLATKLSGSIVTGHVDHTGMIVGTKPLTIQLPHELVPYLFPKGGVTINGVNLTIASQTDQTITIECIPQTLRATSLGQLQVGDQVNVEADYLTKAVQAGLAARRV